MRFRSALTLMVAAGLVAVAAAGAAFAADAPPTPGVGPVVVSDLEKAFDTVAEAARETDLVKSRAIAAGALPTLQAALEHGPASCRVLAVAAEAQIRAGLPKDALRTAALGVGNDCDVAAMLQLSAWAREYDESGERRSPKADLAQAEKLYAQAAELFAERADGSDGVAACLANAAELAQLRGDHAAGARHALRALKPLGAGDMKTRLGLTYLACQGRLVGEGAAVDTLAELYSDDDFLALLDVRMRQISARLDKGHDDAVALAAMGYYSLLMGSGPELVWAGRYLGKATTIDTKLPDLWYLVGRAADARSQIAEAAAAFRRQIAEHPGLPATRLAVNDLCHLLTTSSAPPTELAECLRLLDAELAKTPEEAAMIDTRGRLLVGLGRNTDGLAALRRAQALDPTPERKADIERLMLLPR